MLIKSFCYQQKSSIVFIIFLIFSVITDSRFAVAGLPFDVITARYKLVARERVFDAIIEAVNRASVSAQTSGRVIEINFDVDDYVNRGDVILRLRDKEQRARVNSAQARFKEADANFTRIKKIYAKKLVAKSVYDKASARLQTAQAELDQAKEALAYTIVHAPYSGIVVERHIEPGEIARVGKPLMTGISLELLRATAYVPQDIINTIRRLNRARVILADSPDTSINVASLTISPYADLKSHTFQVRANLPEGQHNIYPGMFAKIAIVIGEENHLVVSTKSIVHRSEVSAVYVVNKTGQVSLRQVRPGRVLDDGTIEILAGLEEGEQVALDPVQAGVYLKEQRAGDLNE